MPHFLDRQYTVFGKVIEGMEFVDKIKRGEPPSDPDKIISFKPLKDALGLLYNPKMPNLDEKETSIKTASNESFIAKKKTEIE